MWRLKTRILGLAILSTLALGVSARLAAGTTPRAIPRWLEAAETLTLNRTFGGARPARTTYIGYRRKIAVVWQFEHVVVCRLCSAPSNAQRPRGRVIRVSYDRRTHRQGSAMQFCEIKNPATALGVSPPLEHQRLPAPAFAMSPDGRTPVSTARPYSTQSA